MRDMKNAVLSLFVAFAVLISPIAHASEIACGNGDCQMLDGSKKTAKADSEQGSEKTEKSAHHCCSHQSAKVDTHQEAPQKSMRSKTFFSLENESVESLAFGPPLKPPSNA